jgi:hypothetical protein
VRNASQTGNAYHDSGYGFVQGTPSSTNEDQQTERAKAFGEFLNYNYLNQVTEPDIVIATGNETTATQSMFYSKSELITSCAYNTKACETT